MGARNLQKLAIKRLGKLLWIETSAKQFWQCARVKVSMCSAALHLSLKEQQLQQRIRHPQLIYVGVVRQNQSSKEDGSRPSVLKDCTQKGYHPDQGSGHGRGPCNKQVFLVAQHNVLSFDLLVLHLAHLSGMTTCLSDRMFSARHRESSYKASRFTLEIGSKIISTKNEAKARAQHLLLKSAVETATHLY